MRMDTNKRLWVVSVGVVVGLILIWFSTSTHGGEKTYEVNTHTLPEYRSDTARAIDAYERVMHRFMNMTDKNFGKVSADVKEIGRKLDAIDNKLTQLVSRIARVETALNINQNPPKTYSAKEDEAKDIQKKDTLSAEALE